MRTNNSIKNRISTRVFCVLVISLLLLVAMGSSLLSTSTAISPPTMVAASQSLVQKASNNDFVDYEPIDLGLKNAHFDESIGDFGTIPDGWMAMDGDHNSGGTNGVIDLTPSVFDQNRDKYKLDVLDSANGGIRDGHYIQTPFLSQNNQNTRTALMVNTATNKDIVTGLASSSMSLQANGFYFISVWVKTSNFAAGQGAAISINGLPQEIAFTNINTFQANGEDTTDNAYNWQKYSFYIRTGYKNESINLGLSVGYTSSPVSTNPTNPNHQVVYAPATGYALFDNITAEQVSPLLYNKLRPTNAPEFGVNVAADLGVVTLPSDKHRFVYEPFQTDVLVLDPSANGLYQNQANQED
ncbi:MAG: hypothetical protein FWD76_04685, partial [Firmicutes bacterium]|nr:hypothetical protein [Bacillota bacterium]